MCVTSFDEPLEDHDWVCIPNGAASNQNTRMQRQPVTHPTLAVDMQEQRLMCWAKHRHKLHGLTLTSLAAYDAFTISTM